MLFCHPCLRAVWPGQGRQTLQCWQPVSPAAPHKKPDSAAATAAANKRPVKAFFPQTFRPRKLANEGNVVQLQRRRHRGETLPRAARAAPAWCQHVAACKVCRHVSHAFEGTSTLVVVRATLHKRFNQTITRLAG